ncbi:MAG: hypothetical protein ACP5PX_04865 [Candidatus Hadarchaeum sp.]|uniref:hypothetical protein n=1 Tax=Candidatus Hadarchaeum sp. TaxID=2883567 RepID=UPI003D14920A
MSTLQSEQSLTGRVVFQYFYDCGGEVELEKVPLEKLNVIHRVAPKRLRVLAPKYGEVGLQPLEISFGTKNIDGHEARVDGRIFPIGVIEIYIVIEFRNASLKSLIRLVRLDEHPVKVSGTEVEFETLAREYFEKLLETIKPALTSPYPAYKHPETYTLIMITESSPKLKAQDFLRRFRKQTAGILRGEKEWRRLSDKEVEDALKSYLSYSEDDIVIVDWYSALMSGAVNYMDELEHMIELAKIQLLELKTYDKLLDMRLERAYDSLYAVFTGARVGMLWGRRWYGKLALAAGELAEWRVEVTDLVEDMRNILKFTGDWYLGKLYRIASERFRIQDWLALVDRKLNQLQELYAMAMERVDVHRARTLELLIILLIAIEVVLALVIGLK